MDWNENSRSPLIVSPPKSQDILLLYVERLGVLGNPLATSLALRCKLSFSGLPSSIQPLSNFAYSTIFANFVPIKEVFILQTLTLFLRLHTRSSSDGSEAVFVVIENVMRMRIIIVPCEALPQPYYYYSNMFQSSNVTRH